MYILEYVSFSMYMCNEALPAERLLGGGADSDEDEQGEEAGSKVTTVEMEFNIRKYIER